MTMDFSKFDRSDGEDKSTLRCVCHATFSWSGPSDDLEPWMSRHAECSKPNPQIYLGDSVYGEWEPKKGMIRLTTNNGLGATNEIWLEPEVFVALVAFGNRFIGVKA